MAWTDYSTGDVLPAAGINDIHQAWNGTAGKAQAMSLTEIDDAANYAFDVTPARLVTGLITERGICKASEEGLLSLFAEQE